MSRPLSTPTFGSLLVVLVAGCSVAPYSAPEPGDVAVSSMNYRKTPNNERVQAINGLRSEAALPGVTPLSRPQFYVFAKGEYVAGNLSFDEVFSRLQQPLAEKGYLSALTVDRNHRAKVGAIDLVLRVHCGERRWRFPFVRQTDQPWAEGLVPMMGPLRDAAEAHSVAPEPASVVAENIFMEDPDTDNVLRSAPNYDQDAPEESQEQTNRRLLYDAREGGGEGAQEMGEIAAQERGQTGKTLPLDIPRPDDGLFTALYENMPTRAYFLVVVEAFDFKELQHYKGRALRKWVTFVSMPKKPGQTFAEALPAMLSRAAPYFGETSGGLAVYSQKLGKVSVGQPYVVPAKKQGS